jgi:hypothetical protein
MRCLANVLSRSLFRTPSSFLLALSIAQSQTHTQCHNARTHAHALTQNTSHMPTRTYTLTTHNTPHMPIRRPNCGLVYQKRCSKARSLWQSVSFSLQTQPGSAALASMIVEIELVEEQVVVEVVEGGQVSGQLLTVPRRDRCLSFSSPRCVRVYVRVFVCARARTRAHARGVCTTGAV